MVTASSSRRGVDRNATKSQDLLLILNRSHNKASTAAEQIRSYLENKGVEKFHTKVVPIAISDWFDKLVSLPRRNLPFYMRDSLSWLRPLFNIRKSSALNNLAKILDLKFNPARSGSIQGKCKIGIILDPLCFSEYLKEIIAMVKEHTKGIETTILVATNANLRKVTTTEASELKEIPPQPNQIEFLRRVALQKGGFKGRSLERLQKFFAKNFPKLDFQTFIENFMEKFKPCIYKPEIKATRHPSWAEQFIPFVNHLFEIRQ